LRQRCKKFFKDFKKLRLTQASFWSLRLVFWTQRVATLLLGLYVLSFGGITIVLMFAL